MLKKKIYVLAIFLLINISSICFADSNWLSVYTNSNPYFATGIAVGFFDTNRVSICGSENDPYLDCWIKISPSSGDDSTKLVVFEHRNIRINDLNYKIIEQDQYLDNVHTIHKEYSEAKWINPKLNNNEYNEKIITNILKWVVNNKEKVTKTKVQVDEIDQEVLKLFYGNWKMTELKGDYVKGTPSIMKITPSHIDNLEYVVTSASQKYPSSTGFVTITLVLYTPTGERDYFIDIIADQDGSIMSFEHSKSGWYAVYEKSINLW